MNESEVREISKMVSEFNEELNTSTIDIIKKSDAVHPDMIDYDPENEEGAPMNSLGKEFPLDDALDDVCGPPNNKDIVDDCILDIIELLARNDYDDDSAEMATYDAIASLIDDGSISDTPDLDSQDSVKAQWIFNSKPKIIERLRVLGVDFDESM